MLSAWFASAPGLLPAGSREPTIAMRVAAEAIDAGLFSLLDSDQWNTYWTTA